jgi:hypothetical protein
MIGVLPWLVRWARSVSGFGSGSATLIWTLSFWIFNKAEMYTYENQCASVSESHWFQIRIRIGQVILNKTLDPEPGRQTIADLCVS